MSDEQQKWVNQLTKRPENVSDDVLSKAHITSEDTNMTHINGENVLYWYAVAKNNEKKLAEAVKILKKAKKGIGNKKQYTDKDVHLYGEIRDFIEKFGG